MTDTNKAEQGARSGLSDLTVKLAAKKPKQKLKLFVWDDFCSDYTSGLAFAVAKDETDARKLITKQHGYEPYNWGILTIYPLSKRLAKSVSGGG